MTKRITPKETHVWLKNYFKQRRDTGLGKAIANLVLHPQGPFETEKRRLPKRGFLFAVCLIAAGVGWFLYFNFAP